MEVYRKSIVLIAGIALPWVLQWADLRRLKRLGIKTRWWNAASWASALYAFGPLSMLGWGWTTRRRWKRCAIGAVGTASAVFGVALIDSLAAWVLFDPASRTDAMSAQDAPALLGGTFAASLGFLLGLESVGEFRRRLRRS